MKVLTDKKIKILTGAILLYILSFSFFSIWKYSNFLYNGMDLAIINQVFYNSINGNFFASSIHPPSYLADHLNPIIFLLLPIYYLFSSPKTLLILQALTLGLSAWPVFLIGKKVIDKNWGLLFALAWLLNPIVQNINSFEFHFLPLAVFFILWVTYFYLQEKYWPYLAFLILALLVREDVAVVTVMFGVVAAINKKSFRWIATPILFSLAYAFFAMI